MHTSKPPTHVYHSFQGWGCRCCSPNGEDGGSSHTEWNVMTLPSGRRLSAEDDPGARKLLYGPQAAPPTALDDLYFELAHAVGVVEP